MSLQFEGSIWYLLVNNTKNTIKWPKFELPETGVPTLYCATMHKAIILDQCHVTHQRWMVSCTHSVYLTGSGPEWNGLRAGFGINPFSSTTFAPMPRTMTEAVADGWVRDATVSCEYSHSYLSVNVTRLKSPYPEVICCETRDHSHFIHTICIIQLYGRDIRVEYFH